MTTALTIAMVYQMMDGDYVPYKATPRSFTIERTRPKSIKKGTSRSFNVNRRMRRNHNIRQPGVDVQRRRFSPRLSKISSMR